MYPAEIRGTLPEISPFLASAKKQGIGERVCDLCGAEAGDCRYRRSMFCALAPKTPAIPWLGRADRACAISRGDEPGPGNAVVTEP